MRIVEYDNGAGSLQDRVVKFVGIGAGIFSLTLCLLMIGNQVSLRRADPIHSPALVQLLDELKQDPRDESLKKQIRELDLLARRAYFSSERFNRVGAYGLLAGLAVMVIAFKTVETRHRRLPYPDPRDPKEDLAANARWARNAVTVAGLTLAGIALGLALPWKSPLDVPQLAGEGSGDGAGVLVAVAPLSNWPSRADMQKQWPSFLGALGGQSAGSRLPIQWDGVTGENIRWKVEVPKPGTSSPVCWDDRVFLSGGDADSREIFCFDANNGALAWRRTVQSSQGSKELPRVMSDTGLAAPTMAVEGSRVFALFANGDLAAFDFEGEALWDRNLGTPDNPYGHGSSLVTFEDLLLVQFDHDAGGAILAFDVRTGEDRWRVQRDFGSSWATPLLVEWEGDPQLIVSATVVVSYHPRTGEELWRLECLKDGEVAPSPVYANGLLYVSADYAGLIAIDLRTRSIRWQIDELMPGVGTPVVVDGKLFYGLGEGGIICRDATNGELLGHEETPEGFYASPIAAGDRVYVTDRSGITHILSTGAELAVVGTPALGEEVVATPAVHGESLIVRGVEHLYRIDP